MTKPRRIDHGALAALVLGHDVDPWWREQALCAQTDPEAFHPEKGQSPKKALAVCAVCPVALDCLTEAMTTAAGSAGIWGGTTENDRRAIRRRLAGTPLGATPGRNRKKERDEAIVLLYRAGAPVPEIAAEVGVSERTVHRAAAAAGGTEIKSSCA